MRSTVYFLPLRTSVTDSVGISTRPILSSSPKAWTRDSSDSLTLRSNPEYEWMMYHFILGLRGCSATAAAPSAGGAPASAPPPGLLGSSCINSGPLLLAEIPEQLVHAPADQVIDNPEIKRKQKHGDQDNRSRGLHFL